MYRPVAVPVPRRAASVVLALVLAATLLVAGPFARPAAAVESVTVTKEAPGEVLVGEPVTFTIRASAPASNSGPLFNGSIRDVLPVGFSYVPGSSDPASAGDPQIVTTQVEIEPGVTAPQQTLLWINLGDLQAASDFALSFRAQPVADDYPVGSSFTNNAGGYASSDPRLVPTFDSQGVPILAPNVVGDEAPPTTTQVTAIEVTKSEPSPEGELLRGVHEHPTVYTVTVRNNTLAATESATVVDYVPAGLEYLACGGVDNTPVDSPNAVGGREYPDAPSLAGTPAPDDCVLPDSVVTVENPTGPGVPPGLSGVYTRLTWTLGDLAPGDVLTLRYAAGVPLRANTLDFGTGAAPTPDSLGQAANLDNNSGSSSREGTGEIGLTNVIRVDGTFTGRLAPGASPEVSATDRESVSVEDVAMTKDVSPRRFTAGGIVTYTLRLRVSEYVDASAVTITDVLPNGVCPLSSTTNFVDGAPADCAPVVGTDPVGASFDDVQQNDDGTFTVVFDDLAIAADGTATVTYQGRMRTVFTGGELAGQQTSSGDSFTNTASLAATTTPIVTDPPGGTGETGESQVNDSSSATQTTGGLSIDKTIKPRAFPYECDTGPYVESTFPDPEFIFRKGDRICFQLEVDFPDTIASRNPVVTDFLPDGTVYEPGSQFVVESPGVPVLFNETGAANGTENPTWVIGAQLDGGENRFAPPGAVLRVRFAAIATRASDTGAVDLTGNLMKLRAESSSGRGVSLRDEVPLGIAPAPEVALSKGVQSVESAGTTTVLDPTPPGQPGRNVDDVEVRQTDEVTFRVDVTNTGDESSGNDVSIRGWQVWDVLPPGITCADVVPGSISPTGAPGSPDGVCTDPGDADHPTFAGRDDQSAIVWRASDGLAADNPPVGDGSQILNGETRTLVYTVRIPDQVSVSTVFTNTAHVRSFNAFTNEFGGTTTFFPAENVDTTVEPTQADAPVARDPSSVFLPDAALVKQVARTGLVESNNNNTDNGDAPAEAGDVVNGETITFRVGVTIPAQTTVYQGLLTDTLPSQLAFAAATAAFSPTGTSPAAEPLPDGFVLDPLTGQVTFPVTYTNGTATDQLVEVEIVARATPNAGGNNQLRSNTARFTSQDAAAGGDPLPALTDTAAARIRIANPRVVKSNDAPTSITAGTVVTFTIRVTNGSNRPPAHDAVVVDCVPGGLIVGGIVGAPPVGTTSIEAGDGTNGCATGETRIEWVLGTPVAAGDSYQLRYTATVEDVAAGGVTYTNTARLTASSFPDGGNEDDTERVFERTDSSDVGVGVPARSKSVTPESLTFGERATFTVEAVFPSEINFYDSAVIDVLPDGFDPDSVDLVSAECTRPDGATCVGGPVYRLDNAAGPGQATRIGWGFGDVLATDAEQTLTLAYTALLSDATASPDLARGDQLANSASVRWNITPGENPTSAGDVFDRSTNPAVASATVTEPELTVAKGVSDETPGPAEPFTYTVTVTNAADEFVSNAFDLQVVDDVPLGVVVTDVDTGGTYTPADPAQGGGQVAWTLDGPLAPGDAITLTYQAVLGPSEQLDDSPLPNTVVVDSYATVPDGTEGRRDYPDRDPNATASVTPQFPELTVQKATPDGELAFIDGEFRWRITVTNTGSAVAQDVLLADTLPPNWVYVPGSAVFTLGGVALPADPVVSSSADPDGNQTTTVSSRNPVTLQPDQSLVLDFRAVPVDDTDRSVVRLPGVGSDVAHVNSVEVTGADASGAPGNAEGPYADSATANARIDSADLSIAKTPDPGFPVAGEEFTWTLTVTNNGPDDARGDVVVSDRLPAQDPQTDPVFVSASGAGWSDCTIAGDLVSCSRQMANPDGSDRPFVAGSSETIQVTVAIPPDVPDATSYVNSAEVVSRTYDPDLTNNTDDADATVRARADLQIVKALSGDLVAGRDATYTLDVRNNGPSLALGPIVLADQLPAEATLVSAGGPGWVCEDPTGVPPGGEVSCTRDADLPPNTPAGQITLVVSIAADQTLPVVNTARVCVDENGTPDGLPDGSCPVVDPDLDNNTSVVETTPTTLADLSLSKLREPADAQLVAGEPATYRFVVDNAGPSDAQPDVTITDRLPVGISLAADPTDVTTPQGTWSCSTVPAGDRLDLTCTLDGPLPSGATSTVDLPITVSPDLPQGSVVENTATVGSPTTDPDTGNNTDTDTTDSSALADLVIVKTHEPEPAVAGEQVTFTIEVRNDGPSDAVAPVTVTDDLPAGLSVVTAQGGDASLAWDCDLSASPLTCTLTDAATGSDAPLSALSSAPPLVVVADVAPAAGPSALSNTARVDSPTTDPDPGNNASTDSVTVVDVADVTVVKATTGANPALAGEATVFTLAVRNAGPSDADGVAFTDTLPDGLGVEGVDAPDPWVCSDDGQTVRCSLTEPLPPGDAPDVVIRAAVRDTVPDGTTLTNTVTISTATDQGDNALPDSASSDVGVLAEADLAVTKALVPPTSACDDVCAGEPVDFTLDVANNGPSTAQPSVRVTDTLPPGFTATGTSDPAGSWECTIGPSDPAGQEVSCVLSGGDPRAPVPLRPADPDVPGSGQAPTLTISAVVSSDAALGPATNTAVVASPTTDPDPADNTDTADVVVEGLADLSIDKTHAPEPATAGRQVDVTLTVTNAGPSDAAATAGDPLLVRDVLPDGLGFVSAASDDGWTCTETPAGTLTCTDAETLPAGATETITVTLLVDPAAGPTPDGQPLVNTAAVCPDGCLTPDPEPGNNTATDEITVVDEADITLEKSTTGPDPVLAGQTTEFTLTVRNAGPSVADDVTVTDTAPTGLVPQSASGDGWACARPAGQQITCDLADPLPPGQERTIVVVVRADSDASVGVVTNTATATTSTPQGPNALPDTDTSDVEIAAEADLAITKALSGALIAGENATYTLDVVNLGPSTARADVVVTDTLPSGTSLVSATGTGWSCTPAPGSVSCLLAGDLPAGEPAGQITVVVAVPSAQVDDLVNASTVGSTVTPDPEPGNNTSAVTDAVTTLADLVLEKESVQPPEFVAGEGAARYRFTTLNAGPSDAVGPLLVTDLLPTGVTFVEVAPGADGWACEVVGADPDGREQLECTRPAGLEAGEQTAVTVVVAIDPSLGVGLPPGEVLAIVNSATVSSPTTDPNEANNTNDDRATAPREADLAVTKSHTPEPVVAGESLTFSLEVTNLGLSTAAGPVVVTDALPNAIAFDSFGDTAGWECTHDGSADGGLVTCVLGTQAAPVDLLPTSAPPISVVATVQPSAGPATVTNRVSVSSTTPDPVLGNNVAADPVTIVDIADVAISKTTTGPDPVLAGETTEFTLAVSNAGPSTADAVRVSDPLPPGMTVEQIDAPDPWDCAGVGTTRLDCSLTAPLPPGQAPDIVVIVREATGTPDGTLLTNTARVSTATDQGENVGPDEDSSTVTVRAEADLVLAKTLVEPTGQCSPAACAGEQVEFTIRVANDGPSDAVAPVAVVDTLPAGLTPVAADGTGDGLVWDCTVADQQVSCVLASATTGTPVALVAGESAPILAVTATVDSDTSDGTLTNSAEVTSPTTDPRPGNNSDDVEVPVETLADVSVVKSHSPEPATAGEQVEVTLTVANDGPSDAAATGADPLVVTDVLPAGLSFVSADSADGWTCVQDPAGTVTCSDGEPLPAGSTETITLTLVVDPSAGPAGIENTATICPDGCLTPDPEPGNNSSTDVITVVDAADVTVVKATTGADPVLAGETTEFTVTVTNLGPSTADDVTVVERLPAGLAFIPTDLPAGPGWTCEPPDGRVITCRLDDPLVPALAGDPGAAALVVPVRVLPGVLEGRTLTNRATVSTSTPGDPLPNNTATSSVLVQANADLALDKTYEGGVVLAGESAQFVLTVTNNGPSDAQPALEVVDDLPPFLSLLGASEGWTCTAVPAAPASGEGQTVTCVDDSGVALPPGGERVLTLDVLVDPAAPAEPLTNRAEVCPTGGLERQREGGLREAVRTCPTIDPLPTNNVGDAQIPVEQLVDLGLRKSHSGQARIGDPLTFTFEVTNAGPSVATGVAITDVLPPGLTAPAGVGVDGAPWSCTSEPPGPQGTPVTCLLAEPLPPSTSTAVEVTVTVGPEAYPQVTNSATVSTQTPESTDPDELPDTAVDTVEVPAQVDLVIDKESDGGFTVGQRGEFSIAVTNRGPTPDPGPVTVSDRLPLGLTPVRAAGTGWTCDIRGQQVTCTDDDGLAVGETTTITLAVDVFGDAAPRVQNTATVTSPSEDLDPSSNTDTAAVDVTVPPTPDRPGSLPSTGAQVARVLLLGLALLAGGALLLVASRRVRIRSSA